MRITFCHNETEYLCDAQSVFLRRLMPELRRLGHEPRLLLIAPRDPEVCSLTAFCRSQGISLAATHSLGSIGNNVRWCLRQLAAHPADVFVPHHCHWALYAARWVKEAGIPSVGVLHSDDEATKRLIDVFCRPGSPFLLDGAVAVSGVIAEQVAAVHPGFRVTTIPCGVPIPQSLVEVPQETLRLAYFGRIVQEQKRILDMARAFARVSREVPGVECHIWGNGSEDEALRRLLETEPGGQRVRRHDAIPADDVYARLREHDVIVLLSDYEGTPTTVMEGMANGLVPIVTGIGGGTAALVEDGVTGLVVRDRDDGFVRAVAMLAAAPDRWRDLSRSAARRVADAYSASRTAEAWAAFLEALPVAGRGVGRIPVPGEVDVPARWRIQGPRYRGRINDVLAGAYASARFAAHRALAPRSPRP